MSTVSISFRSMKKSNLLQKMNMNKLMILAIGGAGCNIAKAIKQKASDKWLERASVVFMDSDIEHLSKFEDFGNLCPLNDESKEIPTELFGSVDSLIIIAGLGGNATHEYLPEIIKVASQIPITDISVVATTPFLFEGEDRMTKAIKTAAIIQNLVNIRIIFFNNEDLVKRFPDLNFINAFDLANNVAMELIETSLVQ